MAKTKSSTVSALLIRGKDEAQFLAKDFLNSPDFDLETIKDICRALRQPSSGSKNILAEQIANLCRQSTEIRRLVFEHLVTRNKNWLAIWHFTPSKQPQCPDPGQLLLQPGKREWYGPIQSSKDSQAEWYVRPEFIVHWDIPIDNTTEDSNVKAKPQECRIRWLCFARIIEGFISLHWRSFTHLENVDTVGGTNSQFHYWDYIPKFTRELSEMFGCELKAIELHNLVLHKLWDKYRHDLDNYEWEDIRIRAESGGVALNARSAKRGAIELDFKGIRRFAHTLRSAFQIKLNNYGIVLPEPSQFDEEILRTIIQDFGAISYELSLSKKSGQNLFRGHSYFGGKRDQFSADSFPHIHIYSSFQDDLEQMKFLLSHLPTDTINGDRNQSEQFSLL